MMVDRYCINQVVVSLSVMVYHYCTNQEPVGICTPKHRVLKEKHPRISEHYFGMMAVQDIVEESDLHILAGFVLAEYTLVVVVWVARIDTNLVAVVAVLEFVSIQIAELNLVDVVVERCRDFPTGMAGTKRVHARFAVANPLAPELGYSPMVRYNWHNYCIRY